MKKKTPLVIVLALFLVAGKVSSIPPCCLLDMGIFNNPANSNKLEVKIRPTINITTGNYSASTFVVRFLTSHNVTLSVSLQTMPVNLNPFSHSIVGSASSGSYTYYVFSSTASNVIQNWPAGVDVLAVGLVVNGGSGTVIFELTNDAFAQALAGDAFYQELAANGENGGGSGQQGVFYNASTSAVLPVELLSFNAKLLSNGSTGLDWESATEKNLAYYDVEHSTDGQQFHSLGKETARGGVQVTTQYAYNHKSPQAGSNFYRLRMVDNDGVFEFSPIRQVFLDTEDADFTIFPNPTSGPLLLTSRHLDKYKTGLTYQLTDNTGKLLRTEKITGEKTNFDLSNEPAGAYYLNILTDREQVVQFPIVVTNR